MVRFFFSAVLVSSFFVGPEAEAARTEVVFYYGNGGYNSAISQFHTQMRAAGASRSYATASWPSRTSQNNAKVWLLVAPNSYFSTAQLNDVKYFVDNGGTLVLVSEWAGFRSNVHNVQNRVSAHIGRNTRYYSVSYDLGCTKRANRTNTTTFSAGASTLTYAASGAVTVGSGGTSLYRRQSASQILVAEERGVVFMSDGNSFGGCSYTSSDYRFWRNLYTGGCVKKTWYRDADGDTWGNSGSTRSECTAPSGYVARGGDCNDGNRSIYPGRSETVGDEIDYNCDGRETCYLDNDNDGWRLNTTIASADVDCRDSREARAAEPGIDCNDANATIYPGAREVIGDEIDQSCDGKEVCYLDNDNDGWRLNTTIASADSDCRDSREARASEPGIDCNDANPAINPGATEGVGDEIDQNCDKREVCYADLDDDGWRTSKTVISADLDCRDSGEARASEPGIDCDDSRKTVYPGADEYCNGRDDDCDKTIDEDDAVDAKTWYRDADGDTYGDAAVKKKACAVPTGYVADDTDCDDKRKETYPGADEYCNGIDDDCDKVIDEDDALDAKTWYIDADGDTYGNPAETTKACKVPSGYVADDTDCDDDDKTVYPGAPEIAYDGIDQDCDGEDLCDVDEDGYDHPLCDGSDCDDDQADINPGAEELWYDGVDQDCDEWSDYDADYDGFDSGDYGGDDCDDSDEQINPDAEEIWYDGIDQNCDGESDYDQDGDGYDSDEYGGEDCDDLDDTVYPGADELEDGIDNDCNGVDETTDSDGDGVPDEVELDIGTDPLDEDSDGDGILDGVELGDDWDDPEDSDDDGTIDALDTDDDGDGILTEVEIGDSPDDDPVDSDGDGTPDYLDLDSDDDGFTDKDEGLVDSDGDGTSDYLDLDSDGDTVLDEDELAEDTDGNGTDDRLDPDDDGDGFSTEVEEAWPDKDLDGDGIDNYLDPDSDGDGTDDIDEGGGDRDCDGAINVVDADDYDGPCATADALTYQSGACGGASTSGVPLGGAGLLLGLFGLLGLRRRR